MTCSSHAAALVEPSCGLDLGTLSGSVSGWQNADCAHQIRIGLYDFSSSSFAKFIAMTCENHTLQTPPLHNLKGLH